MGALLTELDRKLWSDMVVFCDRFLAREIRLRALVDGLEGLLNAGSFEDQSLRKRWYEPWTPLEVRNAMGEADWVSWRERGDRSVALIPAGSSGR